MPPDPPPGPTVEPDGTLCFRVGPDDHWRPQRVWMHLRDFGADPRFRPEGHGWVARIPPPPVARLEYLLDIVSADGQRALVCDPANPRRAPGVFGDKSVVELPGYAEPEWLTAQARGEHPVPGTPGSLTTTDPWHVVSVRDEDLGPGSDLRRERWAQLRLDAAHGSARTGEQAVLDTSSALAAIGTLLAPAGSAPADPLPLLLVHDGPEYAQLAALPQYLSVLAAREPALRCRVLLLRPVDRDRSYSASPGYARALTEGLLPEVRATVAVRGPLVGMGASLGALAMTHVALTRPGTLGAVLCQSGSFFAPDTDAMELGYRFFDRIADFVAGVDADPARVRGLHVALTCGTGEENLANNRRLHRRLRAAGVSATLIENPDGHTYTGWRDCLDPALADLLRAVWSRGQ